MLTEREFFAFLADADQLKEENQKFAHSLFQDWLGCLIAGWSSQSYRSMRSLRGRLSGDGVLNDLGDSFLMGYASHCLECDDSEFIGETHPSAVLFSSLFHHSNDDHRISDLLAASVQGYLSLVPIGFALNPSHYSRGWHGTGTCGALAATVANGRLRGFSDQSVAKSLTVASSLMAGTHDVFGTRAKYLNSARAAENGVLASEFVRTETVGVSSFFASDQRWPILFASEQKKLQDLQSAPKKLSFVKIKEFPVCHCLVPVIQTMKAAVRELKNDLTKLNKVVLELSPYSYSVLNHRPPETIEQAFFSSVFAISTVLANREVDFAKYLGALSRPDQAIATEVEVKSRQDLKEMEHRISLCLNDGSGITVYGRYDRGFEEQDTSFVGAKFEALVGENSNDHLRDLLKMENFSILQKMQLKEFKRVINVQKVLGLV